MFERPRDRARYQRSFERGNGRKNIRSHYDGDDGAPSLYARQGNPRPRPARRSRSVARRCVPLRSAIFDLNHFCYWKLGAFFKN